MMGVQLEAVQSVFEQHGPWHPHDSRFQQANNHLDIGAAILQAAGLPTLNDLRGLPLLGGSTSCSPRQAMVPEKFTPRSFKDTLKQVPAYCLLPRTEPAGSTPPPKSEPIENQPTTNLKEPSPVVGAETPADERKLFVFDITKPQPLPRQELKRRRPATDVDGFNTASLGCKKRRLLRELVTSRLSRPFSFPAMHILNRESVVTGDRRFVRMVPTVGSRRPISPQSSQPPPPQPSQSCILRRAAVLNRFRHRMQEAMARGDPEATGLLAGAAASRQGQPVPLPSPPATQESPVPIPLLRVPYQSPPPPLARGRARPSPPGSPPGLRPTIPTNPALRLPPSPRLRPLRSPELRSIRLLADVDEDELDDESVAFPTSEHESRYDDDPDDVYADFGVIFGGGGEGDDSDEEGKGDPIEDYLDDVDGIPWGVRY